MHPDRLRVSVGPGALAVTRYGHADRAVVLVHGFPLSSFCWRAVAPVLARAGWMAICPDLLGHGESDRPLDAPLDPVAQARWTREAIGALGLSRVALVGHEMGALTAAAVAASAPALVTRLVLVSPLVPEAMPPADVGAMQRETGRMALRLARDLAAAAELVEGLVRGRMHASDALDARVVARATAPFVGREGVRQLLGLARALDAMPEGGADWRAIRARTLLLLGAHETDAVAGAATRFVDQWQATHAERIGGAGALCPEEAPAELAARILTFLTTPESPE